MNCRRACCACLRTSCGSVSSCSRNRLVLRDLTAIRDRVHPSTRPAERAATGSSSRRAVGRWSWSPGVCRRAPAPRRRLRPSSSSASTISRTKTSCRRGTAGLDPGRVPPHVLQWIAGAGASVPVSSDQIRLDDGSPCFLRRRLPTRRSRNQTPVANLGARASRPQRAEGPRIDQAGGTPALPGRAAPGNSASGSRQPGDGQFFVVLSKTSRVSGPWASSASRRRTPRNRGPVSAAGTVRF